MPGSLCLVFACGCCSESEDSLNLLRIQHSNSLCEYVSFFFLELRVHHCAVHSVHNSLLLHLANRASFTCKTDSFSWGHGPDALACKARPSSDQCGTSLSVSLSLSLSNQKNIRPPKRTNTFTLSKTSHRAQPPNHPSQHSTPQHRTTEPPNHATPNSTPDPTPNTPTPYQSPTSKAGRGDRPRGGKTNYRRREEFGQLPTGKGGGGEPPAEGEEGANAQSEGSVNCRQR